MNKSHESVDFPVIEVEPEKMYAAEVLGEDHPDMAAALERPTVFMTGDVYPGDLRRSTKAGKWKRVEMSFFDWLRGGANEADWGLLHHPVNATKEGASIVPSDNIDGERTDRATKTMYAIGIDIDTGNQLEHVKGKLVEHGIFSVLYTTHSHLKDTMLLKTEDIVRKMHLEAAPTTMQVKEYLRLYSGKNLDREFIDQIEIIDAKHHTKDGLHVLISTPPVEKFRVIIPLAAPVELSDLAPSMTQYKEKWADIVCGVCVNMLECEFDTASCDINRLFYTPRHPEGAEWFSAIIQGKPLHIDDIKPYSKDKYVKARRAPGDPFEAGTESMGSVDRYTMPKSGRSLNDWHKQTKDRFLIADVLETHCDDKLRTAGGEKVGTVHIECPFEHMHSTGGGTATMAMNPDANSEGYWTVFCRHDSCAGRHKLEFLQQMLEDEWFPEEVLFDDAFVLPPDDSAFDGSDENDPLNNLERFESTDDWLPAGYVAGKDMIFFEESDGDETIKIPVCGRFDVVGRTADTNAETGAGRIISFVNENGVRVELTLERAALYADGRDVIRVLADRGLQMEGGTTKANERLLNLFRRMAPKRLVPTLHRPGKHGDSFMLPTGEVIGTDVARLHETATLIDKDTRGDLEGWKGAANAALSMSEGNPYWATTICGGFAGVLLDIMEWQPIGLVLSGETSKGKSIGEEVGAAIWGNPKDGKGVFWTASSTPNAYEDLATYGSGTCLMMDELGAVTDKRQLAPLLFVLHTGRGKARKSGPGPGLSRTVEFRPFVVLSSETNIKQEIEAAGIPYRGGMAVRFPDVDVGGGKARTPEEIAKLEACRKNYGHAGRAFVQYLRDSGVFHDPDQLEKDVNAIVAELANGKSPGIRRAARPFAVAQKAGELAIEAGLIGKDKEDARRRVSGAVKACWEAFLSSDEAASANGSESLFESFKSWLASEMDRTILRAGEEDREAEQGIYHNNHDARGRVIGWYTHDRIYLDWKQLETLQIPGSFGKRSALVKALDEKGVLEASSGSQAAFTTLPAHVASLTVDDEVVGKNIRNLRLKRGEIGI